MPSNSNLGSLSKVILLLNNGKTIVYRALEQGSKQVDLSLLSPPKIYYHSKNATAIHVKIQ